MYNFLIDDPSFLPHAGCKLEISIKKGEVLSLVGENGIGKTTLVQRIYSEYGKDISLIEQRPMDFFYDRPLKRIKSMVLGSKRKEISCRLLEEYWSVFQLDKKEERYQSSLSGGEAQALKLCLGLSIEKEIYLLDEPGQFLDKSSKKQLAQILKKLSEAGKHILLVEHDLSWSEIPMTLCQLQMTAGILTKGETWNT